ncbi:MAG: FG-GAP-like repeat-containing protein [Planctomycetota bacterium]|nr:FG-GAP-like repeat-containing protein [Planctomycetota bacterium]
MNHPAQIAIASSILGLGIGSSVHAADPPVIFVGETLFDEVRPSESGLDFVNPLLPDDPRNFLYPFGYACGGVNIGDLDGDGRPDVFCVGGPVANGLYLQVGEPGEMRFERLPDGMVDGGDAWGTGASLVDIDGDGDLDIHVCNYDAPNQLFINESTPGAPAFAEEAALHGLDIRDASIVSSFADVDNDGDLDAYIACNRYVPPNGLPTEAPGRFDPETQTVVMFPQYERYFRAWRTPEGNFEADSYGRDDFLMINTGPGPDGRPRFVDATEASGIDGAGHALAVTWIDVDRDGLVDLHVANDFEDPDRFYRNLGPGEDGVVRFVDVIADVLPYTTWSSMGTDVADLDGDGLLDLMVADMSATTHFKAKVNMGEMGGRQRRILETAWPRQAMRNMVYLDTGLGSYREAAFLAGLSSSDWTWAVKLGDFDLDGRPDVLLTNGMSRNYTDSDRPFSGRQRYGRTQWDHFRDDPPLLERNLAMRNDGDLRFSDVGAEWGLDKYGMSYAAAYGDIDLDGDLDLVVANLNEPVSLYRNGAEGNWLKVRLRGRDGNTGGAGATVEVETKSHGTLVRSASPWRGWASTDDPDLHFGLGDDETVESIVVTWPGNRVQRLGPSPAGELLVIEEPEVADGPEEPMDTMFAAAAPGIGPGFVHVEKPYDDYRIQPLLPGKLSAFGPCMAWADVDGDGRTDVFMGGARDQAGELWMARGDGRFERAEVPALAADRGSEDSDALWFDADGDGRLDLLVLSGSSEFFERDRRLRNRLYLHRGTGEGGPVFEKAPPGVLGGLALNSHAAAAADFDADGDLDLFIGSRSIPGRYPEAPASHLLRNESTPEGLRFTDVTAELAPALSNIGLVTGAAWHDVDDDDSTDLVVACEWGPISVLRNDGGRLVDTTEAAGLAGHRGWWYGLEVEDVDGDGDLDLVGLNAGLNTKYGTPSDARPAVLYFGDMDGSGRPDLIEAKCKSDDKMLPVRGRSCSSGAMPFIRQEFGTFREFASADLGGIYGESKLASAARFEANELQSGVWINLSEPGTPRFEFRPFPRVAQIAPCYDAAIADFDGDGTIDIVLAQNHDHREPETGLWRGGVGQFLRGAGDGDFEAVHPRESGVVLRGDATGLESIDVDGDGDLDLVATMNGGPVETLLGTGP